MKLSREEVIHIAALARMGMSETEIEKAREQLSNILENFEVLKEIDTTDVPPTAQITPAPRCRRRMFWRMPPTVKGICLNCAPFWNKET
jgi:aspartyl/glutamyl-tRNA(Asn/Gln) amidotransferase C subunit